MLEEMLSLNKEILQVFYGIIIVFICSFIVLKTDRLFKISDYQGLRYFRNAFFFYGLTFLVKLIIGNVEPGTYLEIYYILISFSFKFLIMSGSLFLGYSLIWKKIESEKKHNSLFNLNAFVIYFMSLIISILDIILKTNYFLYISQIIIFFLMIFIVYKNSKINKKNSFLKLHLVSVLLGFFIWSFYFIAYNSFKNNLILKLNIYILNLIFFIIFLISVIKITKTKNE